MYHNIHGIICVSICVCVCDWCHKRRYLFAHPAVSRSRPRTWNAQLFRWPFNATGLALGTMMCNVPFMRQFIVEVCWIHYVVVSFRVKLLVRDSFRSPHDMMADAFGRLPYWQDLQLQGSVQVKAHVQMIQCWKYWPMFGLVYIYIFILSYLQHVQNLLIQSGSRVREASRTFLQLHLRKK